MANLRWQGAYLLLQTGPSLALGPAARSAVDKFLFADSTTRRKQPARAGRPYGFGAPDARKAYTAAILARTHEYRELSARYRAGERALEFPEGMYPPPVIQAA